MKRWLDYTGRLFVLYLVTASVFALAAFLVITAAAFPLQLTWFVCGSTSAVVGVVLGRVMGMRFLSACVRLYNRTLTFRDVLLRFERSIIHYMDGRERA